MSRGFSRLHEDGIIEVHGRWVRILDQEALSAAANGGRGGEIPEPRTRSNG